MSTRRQQILDILRKGSTQTGLIADILGAPEPSVRRDIQTLRAEGHYIEYVDGYATLRDAPAAAGVSGGAAF